MHLLAICVGDRLTNLHQFTHIDYLELLVVGLALKSFRNVGQSQVVIVVSDTTMVVACINKQGGPVLQAILGDLGLVSVPWSPIWSQHTFRGWTISDWRVSAEVRWFRSGR